MTDSAMEAVAEPAQAVMERAQSLFTPKTNLELPGKAASAPPADSPGSPFLSLPFLDMSRPWNRRVVCCAVLLLGPLIGGLEWQRAQSHSYSDFLAGSSAGLGLAASLIWLLSLRIRGDMMRAWHRMATPHGRVVPFGSLPSMEAYQDELERLDKTSFALVGGALFVSFFINVVATLDQTRTGASEAAASLRQVAVAFDACDRAHPAAMGDSLEPGTGLVVERVCQRLRQDMAELQGRVDGTAQRVRDGDVERRAALERLGTVEQQAAALQAKVDRLEGLLDRTPGRPKAGTVAR
jgi:hypothetical protein